MTKEEIINEIKSLLSELDNGEDAVAYLTQNDVKWLNENIKALEQETVSRESYEHEYFLRKEFEVKIDKLQRQLEEQILKVRDK
jgi:hypothetical protein